MYKVVVQKVVKVEISTLINLVQFTSPPFTGLVVCLFFFFLGYFHRIWWQWCFSGVVKINVILILKTKLMKRTTMEAESSLFFFVAGFLFVCLFCFSVGLSFSDLQKRWSGMVTLFCDTQTG